MKSFLALACFAASAFAQSIVIGAPADMSSITPGQNITVMIQRPDSLTGSTEVGIGIGLLPCGGGAEGSSGTCAEQNTTDVLGDVVYSGAYDPQFQNGTASLPPYQNFSVAIPATYTSGQQISLAVAHFALVGASATPLSEFRNVTLVVS